MNMRAENRADERRRALRRGDLALTSMCLAHGAITAEIAVRQPDGTWRWAVDQPAIAP